MDITIHVCAKFTASSLNSFTSYYSTIDFIAIYFNTCDRTITGYQKCAFFILESIRYYIISMDITIHVCAKFTASSLNSFTSHYTRI